MEISVIVWGRQTLGRWQAAGKYRWRRQPEGQYSLLYNLSQAALNYLAAAGMAAGPRQQAPAHRCWQQNDRRREFRQDEDALWC